MLQWTIRLRGVLWRSGVRWSIGSFLYQMREAKVSVRRDGSFPNGLRWQTFMACLCSDPRDDLYVYDNSGERPCPLLAFPCPPIRALCGWPSKFYVLWLSPTVFMADWNCYIPDDNGACFLDYEVTLDTRGSERCTTLCFYQLSSGEEPEAYSLLPFAFLRHLVTGLPRDFFAWIDLKIIHRQVKPTLDVYSQFLSIISPEAPVTPGNEKMRTRVSLPNVATVDDLRHIFAHQYHPTVHLDCSQDRPMRLISLAEFNNLVRGSPHLRSVQLPCHLVAPDEADDSLHFLDAWFKSPQVSIRFSGVMPFAALHCIATFHQVAEMTIKVDSHFCRNDGNRHCQALQSYLQPFLEEGSHLELLRICFHGKGYPWWTPVELARCTSRKLRFFSIFWERATNGNIEDLDQAKQWEIDLFPTIVLNCYRNCLKKHLDCRILLLAIKAANEGRVYRMSTNHFPYDIRLANAGIIFCIIHEQVRNQVGLGSFV
jgi:hypothetical protein